MSRNVTDGFVKFESTYHPRSAASAIAHPVAVRDHPPAGVRDLHAWRVASRSLGGHYRMPTSYCPWPHTAYFPTWVYWPRISKGRHAASVPSYVASPTKPPMPCVRPVFQERRPRSSHLMWLLMVRTASARSPKALKSTCNEAVAGEMRKRVDAVAQAFDHMVKVRPCHDRAVNVEKRQSEEAHGAPLAGAGTPWLVLRHSLLASC